MFGSVYFASSFFAQAGLEVIESDASVIDLVGEYQGTIALTGEHQAAVDASGAYHPTIDVIGEAE